MRLIAPLGLLALSGLLVTLGVVLHGQPLTVLDQLGSVGSFAIALASTVYAVARLFRRGPSPAGESAAPQAAAGSFPSTVNLISHNGIVINGDGAEVDVEVNYAATRKKPRQGKRANR
jgi:hypothetical protein